MNIESNKVKFSKKQHYVPQFYLKNFSKDSKHLFIYDKLVGEKGSFRHQTTVDIAHQNNFYTFQSKTGKENLETLFKMVEDGAAMAIQKAREEKLLSEQDKEKIAIFIALQESRTPSFKNKIEGLHTELGEKIARMSLRMTAAKDLKKIFEEESGKEMTDREVEDLKDFAINPKRSSIGFKYPNGWWIKNMLETAMTTTPAFMCMDWIMFYTKKPYAFITNDKPLMIVPPKNHNKFWGIGLLTPGVKRIIPLSSDLCLVMCEMNKEPVTEFREAKKSFYKEVNEHLVSGCYRFCFSPELGKLEKLVKQEKPYNIKFKKEYSVS